jgi:F-type H+-transporting ATPase subunit alpha
MERQVVSLWAAVNGHLDDLPVASVRRFEQEWLAFVASSRPQILEAIASSKALAAETVELLKAAVAQFKSTFAA